MDWAGRTWPIRSIGSHRLRTIVLLECRLLARSTTSWLLLAGILALFVGGAITVVDSDLSAVAGSPFLILEANHSLLAQYWLRTADLLVLALPLLAFLFGYETIVSEREHGTISVLGALPVTRGDIFVGKALARIAVFTLGLGFGLLSVGVGGAVFDPDFDFVAHLVASLATIAFGTALVSTAVSLSALVSTHVRALTGAVVGYLVLLFGGASLLMSFSPLVSGHPFQAYSLLVAWRFDAMHSPLVVSLVDGSPVIVNRSPLLTAPAAIAVLCAWTCATLAVGYRQFRHEVIHL